MSRMVENPACPHTAAKVLILLNASEIRQVEGPPTQG
jgi:hypothetical protein